MRIRPAITADIPAILALERSAPLAAHWTPIEYERAFSAGQTPRVVLVADEGGDLRGFLIARALGPDWEIENIAVAASAQRARTATALMESFLEIARHGGAVRVYLEVRGSNQPARALYEKCGFIIAGQRKAYYRDPVEDAVVYQRVLSP